MEELNVYRKDIRKLFTDMQGKKNHNSRMPTPTSRKCRTKKINL
jgi:hypothetical protein